MVEAVVRLVRLKGLDHHLALPKFPVAGSSVAFADYPELTRVPCAYYISMFSLLKYSLQSRSLESVKWALHCSSYCFHPSRSSARNRACSFMSKHFSYCCLRPSSCCRRLSACGASLRFVLPVLRLRVLARHTLLLQVKRLLDLAQQGLVRDLAIASLRVLVHVLLVRR